MSLKIAPSILSADLGHLADALSAAEEGGADWIHLDVMDGHFVPNITIGPLIAAAARKATRLPLDTHLMISDPDAYIEPFVDAGVDSLTVHVEVCPHLHRTVQSIHEAGARAGVSLNPGTPVSAVEEILPWVDLVLVMSVNPGFGGQKFIEPMLNKVRRIRAMLDEMGSEAELQVDGGVGQTNIAQVAAAGATCVVAGTAVYNESASPGDNIRALRAAASPGTGR